MAYFTFFLLDNLGVGCSRERLIFLEPLHTTVQVLNTSPSQRSKSSCCLCLQTEAPKRTKNEKWRKCTQMKHWNRCAEWRVQGWHRNRTAAETSLLSVLQLRALFSGPLSNPGGSKFPAVAPMGRTSWLSKQWPCCHLLLQPHLIPQQSSCFGKIPAGLSGGGY